MIQRCYTPTTTMYHHYGGRGITVCDRWHDVRNFMADMESSYAPGLEIDRIDSNGHYEPCNVRWATRVDQMRNRRTTIMVDYQGQTKPLPEWCEILSLDYTMVSQRLRKLKWTPERAFTEPNRQTRITKPIDTQNHQILEAP